MAATAFHSPVVERSALGAAGFSSLIRKPVDPPRSADELEALLELPGDSH